jgi:hypothetical protein
VFVPRQLHKGREEVYFEGQLVGGRARTNQRTSHQQRYAGALFVGLTLPVEYAVLAMVPTVIRGEHDVGVLKRSDVSDLGDHRLHQAYSAR